MMISRETWVLARRIKTMVRSHPAGAARAVNRVSKPDNMDNMIAASKVVVSSVAKKKRETWKTTRKISAPENPESPEVRIVAARIAN